MMQRCFSSFSSFAMTNYRLLACGICVHLIVIITVVCMILGVVKVEEAGEIKCLRNQTACYDDKSAKVSFGFVFISIGCVLFFSLVMTFCCCLCCCDIRKRDATDDVANSPSKV